MRWKERKDIKPWNWRKWFAWRPVKTILDENGSRTWVWLETVWRQGFRANIAPYKSCWRWDYAIDKPKGAV